MKHFHVMEFHFNRTEIAQSEKNEYKHEMEQDSGWGWKIWAHADTHNASVGELYVAAVVSFSLFNWQNGAQNEHRTFWSCHVSCAVCVRDWRACANIMHLFILISCIFLWTPTSITKSHTNAHARLHKTTNIFIYFLRKEKREREINGKHIWSSMTRRVNAPQRRLRWVLQNVVRAVQSGTKLCLQISMAMWCVHLSDLMRMERAAESVTFDGRQQCARDSRDSILHNSQPLASPRRLCSFHSIHFSFCQCHCWCSIRTCGRRIKSANTCTRFRPTSTQAHNRLDTYKNRTRAKWERRELNKRHIASPPYRTNHKKHTNCVIGIRFLSVEHQCALPRANAWSRHEQKQTGRLQQVENLWFWLIWMRPRSLENLY